MLSKAPYKTKILFAGFFIVLTYPAAYALLIYSPLQTLFTPPIIMIMMIILSFCNITLLYFFSRRAGHTIREITNEIERVGFKA